MLIQLENICQYSCSVFLQCLFRISVNFFCKINLFALQSNFSHRGSVSICSTVLISQVVKNWAVNWAIWQIMICYCCNINVESYNRFTNNISKSNLTSVHSSSWLCVLTISFDIFFYQQILNFNDENTSTTLSRRGKPCVRQIITVKVSFIVQVPVNSNQKTGKQSCFESWSELLHFRTDAAADQGNANTVH